MSLWLSLRQPYDSFWGLAPVEILRVAEGYGAADEREHERLVALNHHLAALMVASYHDPKKLPQYEPPKQTGSRQAEIEDIQVRAALMAMAGKGG